MEDEISRDERTWATICHLAALVMIPYVGIIVGPLVVWLIKRTEYPFVDDQGKQALNFQITVFLIAVIVGICGVVGFFWGFATMKPGPDYFPVWPFVAQFGTFGVLGLLGLLDLILIILGAVTADKGERYRYPFAIRFIK